MTVREHKSQHDHVESLPLISKSATVTEVEAMDRDRREAIRRRLRGLGGKHGFREAVPAGGPIDWDRIFEDLPYHEAFTELEAGHENFHYVSCLSRESWLSAWEGETEYIQDALLKYVDERALEDAAFGRHMAAMLENPPTTAVDARIDPHELEVYACGINAMVYSLETAVKRLGILERHIHCEGYG